LPSELFAGSHKLLEKGYSPMTVRFFMLQSHYSSTLDFSNEALSAAEKGFKKLNNALGLIKSLEHPKTTSNVNVELEKNLVDHMDKCFQNMSDDFNTAKTLAVLFEMSSQINTWVGQKVALTQVSEATFERYKSTYVSIMEEVLGLKEESGGDNNLLDGTINVLINLRKKVRTDKNFALSDKIRDDLKAIGIQLKDGKDGEMSYEIEN
jgi:cysteinyl-tRNA synthetase